MSEAPDRKDVDRLAPENLSGVLEAVLRASADAEEARQSLLSAEYALRRLRELHQAVPKAGPIDIAEMEWDTRTDIHWADSRVQCLKTSMEDLLKAVYGD